MAGFKEFGKFDGLGLADLVKRKEVSPEELLDLIRLQISKDIALIVEEGVFSDTLAILTVLGIQGICCGEGCGEHQATFVSPGSDPFEQQVDRFPGEDLNKAKDQDRGVGIRFGNELLAIAAVCANRNSLFGDDLIDGIDGDLRWIDSIHHKALSG